MYWVANFFSERNYRANDEYKKAMLANLRVILGEGTSEEEVDRIARETYRNFGKSIGEFFRMARLGRRFFEKRIIVRGREHLDGALDHGKGVVLISAHLGNWELAGAKFVSMGFQVHGIALDHEQESVTRLFQRQRELKGVRTYPLSRGTRPCLEALRRNELVCLLGDRDLTGTGIEVEYFGRPAKFPVGPARFCLATGAPLLPTIMVRQPDDSFELIFEDPIYPPESGEKKELVQQLTQMVANVCEKYVRAHPEQFVNFFRIWEDEK
jgi:KDO2-lipid IV(A) lauroyltransferase